MNGRRFFADRDFLVRDLVRDYCTVFHLLAAQRRRFELDGAVSYTALRDLLGEAIRKGVFWRLKDTAHHLFRTGLHAGMELAGLPPEAPAAAQDVPVPGGSATHQAQEALIDWCIGYAFHECAKLKEDAFQGQHYANRLIQISRHAAVTAEMCNPLRGLGGQTAESSSRELSRIMHVLGHGLRLLASYLAVERHNRCLARWLASEESLARQTFGPHYEHLLAALYEGDGERLHLMAARDFLEAGRRDPAVALLTRARRRGLLGTEGCALLEALEQEARCGQGTDMCAVCGKESRLPCLPFMDGKGHGAP